MSTIDSEDRNVTGYFLPEDTQLRLKQLREYVGFLTNLARPRRPDEDSECYNEIRPGEVAICFELIEEQIGLVLDELSYPAERGEPAEATKAAADTETESETADTDAEEPYVAEPATNAASIRYVAGVTLSQIDEMHLLNITVARAHEGRGHARAMLSTLYALCRLHRAGALWLEVRESNDRARALYRREGFAEAGRRRGYYPAPQGRREDAILMTRGVELGGDE